MIDLFNSDCLEIMKNIADESIDLICTDPPYKVTPRGSSGGTGGMLKKKINMQGKVFQHNDVQIKDYAKEFFRILKNETHCYVMTNNINLQEMLNTFIDCGFCFVKLLVWDKQNKICNMYYMQQCEYILFFRKGKARKINHCGSSDLISIPNKKQKDKDGNNLHDTEKPVSLMEVLIGNSTKENDIVLDSFMGIGSTGVACKNLNRNFIGIELDKNYFEIAKQRIENDYYQEDDNDFETNGGLL